MAFISIIQYILENDRDYWNILSYHTAVYDKENN